MGNFIRGLWAMLLWNFYLDRYIIILYSLLLSSCISLVALHALFPLHIWRSILAHQH